MSRKRVHQELYDLEPTTPSRYHAIARILRSNGYSVTTSQNGRGLAPNAKEYEVMRVRTFPPPGRKEEKTPDTCPECGSFGPCAH